MTDEQTPEPENSELRQLLTQVADGSLDPHEAAGRLPEGDGVIRRLVVRMSAAKLVLIGDPSVTGATVEGRHVARRERDTLVVTTEEDEEVGGFAFDSPMRRFGRMIKGPHNPHKIAIRVNPNLPVDLVVSAGSVVASGLHGGLKFACDAGSIKAHECSGQLDGRVATGSAALDWLLESGNCRLRCELGTIKVNLHPRSSVAVRARSEMGTVDLGNQKQISGAGATGEWTMGAGDARLDIDVSLGTVKVAER
jgi:hypothetical protein